MRLTLIGRYAVFVTHERREVVLAVRGTLSFADALTDVHAAMRDATSLGRAHGFYGDGEVVHEGARTSDCWRDGLTE